MRVFRGIAFEEIGSECVLVKRDLNTDQAMIVLAFVVLHRSEFAHDLCPAPQTLSRMRFSFP